MSAATTPLVRVTDLAKSFGALAAVDGISFHVAPGEVVSIIGPNGSGKTTTINLLAGELRPDRGNVVLGRTDIAGRTPDVIARAGLRRTFQNGRVFGNATVEENVLVGQTPLVRASAPLPRLRRIPVLRWIALIVETVLARRSSNGSRPGSPRVAPTLPRRSRTRTVGAPRLRVPSHPTLACCCWTNRPPG